MFFLGFNKKRANGKTGERRMDGRTDGQTDRRIVWNTRPLLYLWDVKSIIFCCQICVCAAFWQTGFLVEWRLLLLFLYYFLWVPTVAAAALDVLDPVWWRTKIVDRCWGQCLQDSFIFTCFYPTTINCLVKQPSFFCFLLLRFFFSFKAKFVYLSLVFSVEK